MSFREYAAEQHSFPVVLRLQSRTGSLLYYGAAHTNDPATPRWRRFSDSGRSSGQPPR